MSTGAEAGRGHRVTSGQPQQRCLEAPSLLALAEVRGPKHSEIAVPYLHVVVPGGWGAAGAGGPAPRLVALRFGAPQAPRKILAFRLVFKQKLYSIAP